MNISSCIGQDYRDIPELHMNIPNYIKQGNKNELDLYINAFSYIR